MPFLQFIMSKLRRSIFKFFNENGSVKVNGTVKDIRSFSTSPLLLSDSETGHTNVSENNLDHGNEQTEVSMDRCVSEGSSVRAVTIAIVNLVTLCVNW